MKRYLLFFLFFLTLINCAKGSLKRNESLELKQSKDIEFGTSRIIKSSSDDLKSKNPLKSVDEILDNRKIIKSGSINYEVKAVENIENIVGEKVTEFGGYIVSSNFSVNRVSISVNIPVENFDDFLKEANKFGKITHKSISAKDVTKEYFDLEGRIKNKKIHQERIRDYIAYAKNIDDLIKYENELNRVTNELESLEGSFKNLSQQISFSSLKMEFSIPYIKKISRRWPSVKNELNNLSYFIVVFLFYFIKIIIYFIIICIPILVLIGGIYYISFGKLGIVKKMFKYLSTEKKAVSRKK